MTKRKKKLADKKATVLKTEKKSRIPIMIAAVAVIAASLYGAFAHFKSDEVAPAVAESSAHEEIVSQLAHPTILFDDGRAKHFEYTDGGITVRYFVVKSSDGVLRAAFDACDVCWPAGKGYYQEGDDMVCRNCGRKFPSVRVNEVQGGCNPAPLERSISGDKLVILVEDILEGKKYFDFSKTS